MDEDEIYSSVSDEAYEEPVSTTDEPQEEDPAADTSEWGEDDDALQGEEIEEDAQDWQGESRGESTSQGTNYTASDVPLVPFTDEALEEYADRMGWTPDQTAVAGHMVGQLIQYYNRTNGAVQSVLSEEARSAPEFFREYGPRIQNHLEGVDPKQRTNRRMVQMAAIVAYLEQAKPDEDLKTVVTGLARKLTGGKARPTPLSAPEPRRPVVAPERQTPAPTRSGRGATRPASRETTTSSFLKRYGLNGIHARDIEYALKTRDGWR